MYNEEMELKSMTGVRGSWLIIKDGISYDVEFSSGKTKKNHITQRQLATWLNAIGRRTEKKDIYPGCDHFLYQYGRETDFSSKIILPSKEIIVPSKEIKTSIAVVNDTLLEKARQNPKIMYTFTPREFEMMVCELLDKQGYNVKLTKQTRDGGKDIIVIQNSLLGEFCIFVECKKYDAQNPISVGMVRSFYGTVMAEAVTAGVIMTTSYFTRDAQEFSRKIKHRMALMDYDNLVQTLNNIEC